MAPRTKISLTGIFIKDPTDGGFTAFFSQVPEAVAEGDNEEEAMYNLLHSLSGVLEVKAQALHEEQLFDGPPAAFFTKSFDFEYTK